MAVKHKTFISYHHANDEAYKLAFKKIFADIHEVIIANAASIDDLMKY
jgi:hypothetical protein